VKRKCDALIKINLNCYKVSAQCERNKPLNKTNANCLATAFVVVVVVVVAAAAVGGDDDEDVGGGCVLASAVTAKVASLIRYKLVMLQRRRLVRRSLPIATH